LAEKLAIHGGKPAITISSPEQWKRPIEEEKRLINELIDKGIYSLGSIIKEFEEEFREFSGCEYCLTTDHGGTAIANAFYAAGLGPGDEFIVPTVGYLGGYFGGLHMGARPVFCDIDPKTLLIDPEDAERRITKRTRLIHPVHMHGAVCDMDALMDIGRRYGIAIVVDAAHAHAAEWDGKKAGNVGDIVCFSLQGGPSPSGKPVSGGEGGIVTTNNREFYERLLIYGHLHRAGIDEELKSLRPPYRMLDSEVLGWKMRIHPFAAALAKVSLSTLSYRNERMLKFWKGLCDGIRELPGLDLQHTYNKAKRDFYAGAQILYNPDELGGLSAEKFVEAMRAEGAPLSRGGRKLEHLRSIFTQGYDLWGHGRGPLGGEFMGLPPFKGYKEGDFPVAESLRDKILLSQVYVEPKEAFLDQYIEAFRKVTSNYKSLL